MKEQTPEQAAASLRLDKWLWFARLARTRSLAAKLCAGGAVAVGGVPAVKPNRSIRIGDWITLERGRLQRRLQVRALGVRRGPAPEARLLYDEPKAPVRLDDRAGWTPLFAAEDCWDEEGWAR